MDSSVVALDLSDVQLDSFPTLVLQHTQLEVLILNGGYNKEKNFKTLPTEIAKLQNLKNLQLNYCQIDSLAPQIGELKNLTTLELSGNKFTSLPAQIGELKNLTTLDLSSNSLTSLPAQIGELKNLTELDLYGSQFTSLPAQIGELKNLTELDLYGSQLTSLPPQIGELKNLTTLDLSYNDSLDLASVCMAFAKYPKKIIISSDIRVSNNDTSTLLIKFNTELTSLPVQIGELKNLTTLNLQDNSLTSLPAQIGELKNLNKLYLSSNQLTSLPAQIGELKNLNKLYLGGNQFTSLPTQIGKLKNLTVLDLERNQLRSLPTQIGELKNLTELNLIGNLLQSLPPSFFTWKVSKTMEYDELVKSAADSANFAFAQQIYEGIKDKKELPNTNYGDLSWWFVFAHCFEGAIWAGERYVAGGGKEIGQFSNLAMGYLYNGEYEKAKAIYAEYKNEKDSYDRTGKEIFLKDLRAVAAAKVPAKNPADVEKMMRFLEE
jgi:Leucine-rich repeat (LRR) protein